MAWEARLGLKPRIATGDDVLHVRQNGLGSPSGIETCTCGRGPLTLPGQNGLGSPSGIETITRNLSMNSSPKVKMAWEARLGLKLFFRHCTDDRRRRQNGLGSPSGIETIYCGRLTRGALMSKWPGKPVWD